MNIADVHRWMDILDDPTYSLWQGLIIMLLSYGSGGFFLRQHLRLNAISTEHSSDLARLRSTLFV